MRINSEAPEDSLSKPPAAEFSGTIALVIGIALTYFTAKGDTPSLLLRYAGYGIGLSLGVSFLFDLRRGFQNLVRTDFFALLAIYGLTLAEFFFPQEKFDMIVDKEFTKNALGILCIGIISLALGRHIYRPTTFSNTKAFTAPIPPMTLFYLLLFCFSLGFLHQWVSVGFNVLEWLEGWMKTRFGRPWTRGMLGGWGSLLGEFGLLINVVPPLCGLIFARWRYFSVFHVVVSGAILILVLFHSYTEGTRNIFFSQVLLFTVSLCFFTRSSPRMIILILGGTFLFLFYATSSMLAFRDIGFGYYWSLKKQNYRFAQEQSDVFFVDYNVYNMGRIFRFFPEKHPFLGFEIYYMTLIRPIPRALWKDKPRKLSVSIEDALYTEGEGGTWSITYLGEAWMAYGRVGVIVTSLLFGIASSWWNRFCNFRYNSDLGMIIYACGFLSFLVTMRSLMTFTITVLPTAFLIVVATWLSANYASHNPKVKTIYKE